MNKTLTAVQQNRLAVIRSMPMPIPKSQRHTLSIKDVAAGGFLKFSGKIWKVEEVSRYDEYNEKSKKLTGDTTFELRLFCLETGETGWLEWSEDDEVEIYFTTKEIHFRDLKDENNDGIDEDDLEQIVSDEDSIYYQGAEFEYDDDWPSFYHRGCGEKSESVYMYEFWAESGTSITIEEWIGDEYHIFLSAQVNARDIEILVTSGS
jgi:hypothetical protein